MLYCKNCGAIVGQNDMFCTSCSSRLSSDTIVTKTELSGIAAGKQEFTADAVAEPDLTGFGVMGMRLTEKLFSLMGADYYRAVKANGEKCVPLMIRHIIIPGKTDRDCAALNNLSAAPTAKDMCADLAEGIKIETAEFVSECAAAGVPSLNYSAEVHYSELFDVYHIFTLMNYALPLPIFIRQKELTVRNALEVGKVIADIFLKLEKNRISYGAFTDCMIFIGQENEKTAARGSVSANTVYPDCRLSKCYEKYLPMCSYMSYFRQFLSPKRQNYEVYSLGMIIYRLLSGGRHPYVSHSGRISAGEFMQAERLRVTMSEPVPPGCLQNTVGKLIGDVLTRCAHEITLSEFSRILVNSMNYVQAGELNKKIEINGMVGI